MFDFTITADDLFLYFNILCGVILLITILFGFINGLFKTTFMTSFFIIILVVGAITIPLIANGLLNVNLSFVNQYLTDFEVEITTIRASLPEILAHFLPEQAFLFEADSESLMLIFGIFKMVVSIILWIVLLILNFSLFKFIAWIIWLIIKPKKNKKSKKKKNNGEVDVADNRKKPKKHRLLGALVGAVKGMVLLLLLSIPMSGISSFASSVTTILDFASSFQGDASNTQSLDHLIASANEEDDIDDDDDILGGIEFPEEFAFLSDVLSFISGYRTTILGKTYSFIDTKLFDSLFKIKTKTGDETVTIKIREEVENVIGIVNIVLEATDGITEIDQNILKNIDDEKILSIGQRLSKIKIIKVVASIAMEYVYHEFLVPNDLLEGYEEDLTLNALKTVNISNDFVVITEALILLKGIEFVGEIQDNIFILTDEQATEIFDKLAELDLLKKGLPIALNFLLNLDEIQTLIVDYNIESTDIIKPTSDDLINDFKNIAHVYSVITDLDITSIDDLSNFQEAEFIQGITDLQIKNLIESIFTFNILDNNTKLVSNLIFDLLINQLPEEFSGIITAEAFENNFNAKEFTNLALIAKVLLDVGVLGEDFDTKDLFTAENIEKLATRISSSELIDSLDKDFILTLTDSFELPFTIEIPSSVTFYGENGKAEISALLTAFKVLIENELFDESFDAALLSNEAINELATSISTSIIMSHNIPIILTSIDFGINIEIPETVTFAGEAGRTEVVSLLTAYRDISALGLLDEGFNAADLSNEDIDSIATSISNSKIMAHNIPLVVKEIDFGMEIVIPEDVVFEGAEGKIEITALLTAYRDVSAIGLLEESFDAANLSNEDIDSLATSISSSKIMSHNIPLIIETIDFVMTIEIPEDVSFEGNNGYLEISSLLTAYRDVSILGLLDEDFDAGLMTNEDIESLALSISNSKIMADNIPSIFETIELGVRIEIPEDLTLRGPNGKIEIESLLTAYRDVTQLGLLDENFNAASLENEDIDNLAEAISKSRIMAHNLPKILETVNFDIAIEIPDDITLYGPPGKLEISSLLTTYREVSDVGLLDENFDANDLTNEKILSLSTSISNSRIMAHNIPAIFDTINFGMSIEIPENTVLTGPEGQTEISALLTTYRDVQVIGLLDEGFDAGGLTNIQIDNLATSMSNSSIMAHNIPILIDTIDFGMTIEIPEGTVFKGEPGRVELEAMLTAYRDVNKIGLLDDGYDAGTLSDTEIGDLSTSLSTSNIMAHNIPILIDTIDFGMTIEIPEGTVFKGEPGRVELDAMLTAYRDVNKIGLLDDGYDAGTLSDTEIGDLSTSLSTSNIMAHNIPLLIDTIDFGMTIEIPEGTVFKGEPGRVELETMLSAYRDVNKIGLLNDGYDAGTLSDTEIGDLSTSLSTSNIMAHNIPLLIDTIDFGMEIEIPEGTTFKGEPGRVELEAMLTAYRDVNKIGLLDDGYDAGTLSDTKIGELSVSLSTSNIMAHNIPILIDTIDFGMEIEIPEGTIFKGEPGRVELEAMLTAYRDVNKIGLLNDGYDAGTLSDTEIGELSVSLSTSNIMAHNIPLLIDSIDFGMEIEIPEGTIFKGEPGRVELEGLLTSYRDVNKIGLLNDGFDAGTLNDTEIGQLSTSFSSSKIMAHNIPLLIDTIDFPVEIIIPDGIEFYGEPGRIELDAMLTAYRDVNSVGLLDSGFNPALLEESEIDTLSTSISSSVIMTANIPTFIDTLSGDKSFTFLNNPDVEVVWDKTELYYTLKSVKIFSSNDTSVTSINNLSNAEINTLARSKYVSNTMGLAIIDMNEPGGTLDGKVIIPNEVIWYSTDTTTGELENLLIGFKEIVGTDDLATFNPNTDALLDTDMNIVFNSIILELTLVEKHIQPLIKTGALSSFLNYQKLDNSDYRWFKNSELYDGSDTLDFLNTIKGLRDDGLDFNDLQYDGFTSVFADTSKPAIVNDRLLESEIFRNSFSKMFNVLLNDQGNLNLTVYSGNDLDYWGIPADNLNPVVRKELFFILDALTAGNELNDLDFLSINQTRADDLKVALMKVPQSETLTPLLDKIVNSDVLSILSDYRTPVNTTTLTTAQWENEIDVLLDVIVQVNEGFVNPPDPFDPEQVARYYVVKELLNQSSTNPHTILYTSESWPF